MTVDEVRSKYIKFFKAKPRNHVEIKPAPLVLEDDPTTLFTSSGMQPLVPYLLGKKHPKGKRLVNSQPSIRLQDIDEVGDNRHTTFFEMLGNWSLGDYFKEEQLRFFFDFLTDKREGLGLRPDRLYVSVFNGDERFNVVLNEKPQLLTPDIKSADTWKKIFADANIKAEVANISNKTEPDIKKGRIFYYGVNENWWSKSGTPKKMPVGEIGGPDSEVFYDFGEDLGMHEKSSIKKPCHPNCDCGRFLEIGNSVFIQYRKISEKTFEELPQKNVDFGGGLERLTAATNKDPDIFNIDLFQPLLRVIAGMMMLTESDKIYKLEDLPRYPVLHEYFEMKSIKKRNTESVRKMMDHARSAVMLASDGVQPGNKKHGAVLRRLINGVITEGEDLGLGVGWLKKLVEPVIQGYKGTFVELGDKRQIVESLFTEEEERFRKKIENGKKQLYKIQKTYPDLSEKQSLAISERNLKQYSQKPKLIINDLKTYGSLPTIAAGTITADMQTTYGLPVTTSGNLMKGWSDKIDYSRLPTIHRKVLSLHKDLSRKASGVFKGGLADHSYEVKRLHTATHLLQAALRKVLGDHVEQKGQNITKDRSRFDFSHEKKLGAEEIKKVEKFINDVIKKDLPVKNVMLEKSEAEKSGALHFFGEKYGDEISVYFVGKDLGSAFSKEYCGGPHVKSTGEIGRVKIKRQEKIGAGVIRFYLETEK